MFTAATATFCGFPRSGSWSKGELSGVEDGGGGNDVIDARLDFDPNSRGMVDEEVMGSAGGDDVTLSISAMGDLGLLTALVDGDDGYDIAHVSRLLLRFVVNRKEIFVLG